MTWLTWDRGRARLTSLGAMLTNFTAVLPDGREVSPLHKASWLEEQLPGGIPPFLAGLQGEFPCVPFGTAPRGPLARDWAGSFPSPDPWPHGFAANNNWQIAPDGPHAVRARITYPETEPVHRLSRCVRGVKGEAAVDIALGVHTRRKGRLPIGVHPVFRLPEKVGLARLCPGGYDQIFGYPGDNGGQPAFEYSSPFRFEDLTGLGFDPLTLPYAVASETLLLLSGTERSFALENHAENYRVSLDWDAQAFPSLLLWISNCGRRAAPWNGRHRALGVEPVCSAFDLGPSISVTDNLLTHAGVQTARMLTPDQTFTTGYRISVAPL